MESMICEDVKDLTVSNTFPLELLSVENESQLTGLNCTESSKKKVEKYSKGVYSLLDFQNKKGIGVPYWEDTLLKYNVQVKEIMSNSDDRGGTPILRSLFAQRTETLSFNLEEESYNNNIVTEDSLDKANTLIPHLGPCNLPKKQKEMDSIKWETLIQKNIHQTHLKQSIVYPVPKDVNHFFKSKHRDEFAQEENLEGFCRPGFLIIGAGKCGTSSLYQYLVGHNRVLPSKQKQVQYFQKNFTKPMSWYLSHFYGTEDFLSSGGLMTGEASPGYLVSFNLSSFSFYYVLVVGEFEIISISQQFGFFAD